MEIYRCACPLSPKGNSERQLDSRPYLGNRTVDACALRQDEEVAVCGQALGLLVPVSCTHYWASTSGLSTPWSSGGPYPVNPVGDLILKRASRLDAFSGYPCRT